MHIYVERSLRYLPRAPGSPLITRKPRSEREQACRPASCASQKSQIDSEIPLFPLHPSGDDEIGHTDVLKVTSENSKAHQRSTCSVSKLEPLASTYAAAQTPSPRPAGLGRCHQSALPKGTSLDVVGKLLPVCLNGV